jgi:hypothetical protein
MIRLIHCAVVFSLTVFALQSVGLLCAAEQEDALLKLVPPASNVVAVIHVDQVLGSARGIKEDWAGKQQDRFLAGASAIPPNVTMLVQGMQLRPEISTLIASTTVMPFPEGFDLWAFADQHKDATVDTIAGVPAVLARHNSLYMKLPGSLLAVLTPAARQEAARYVRYVEGATQTELASSYLSRTARLPHQIVIAMDLQDVARPDQLRQEVAALEGVRGNDAQQRQLAELLMTLEGVRFCADVRDATSAVLAADFRQAPGEGALLLKPLMLRLVADAGLHVGELDTATAVIEGNSLSLRMNAFSDTSLRMVLSLVSSTAPSRAPAATANSPASGTTTNAIDAKASRKYFDTISQSLDDLETATRRSKGMGQSATWYDNMARKIDKLPTRGVDPELVDYGAATSRNLKGLAASLKGVAVEVNTVGKSLVWKSTYDPGYTEANIWGGLGYRAPSVQVDSNLQQVREKQADAVIRGEKDRETAWRVVIEQRDSMKSVVQARFGRE